MMILNWHANDIWKAWNSNDMLYWKSMNWWLQVLKCKTMCEKASETKNEKGSCTHSKDVSIQMSLFLYLLNMVTIIRVSYPEKSNRVQSRSCHVSLIKLDIVVVKNWNQWNLYILASLMTNGKIGLNSIGNLCHLLCQIPLYFGLECNMSCLQSIFISHIFNKNKSPCFSPINWVHIVAYLTMHYLVCFYLSLLWVTRLGTTPLPISWQKGGVGCGKGSCYL